MVLSPLKHLEHNFNNLKFGLPTLSCLCFLGLFTLISSSIVYIDATFFFFNLFIYFNWRLITLQYCGGFCHTLTWISHGCTCVPHPEPPSHFPPNLIPLGCPSAPALSAISCIELGLIIYFTNGNTHVSMLFSQIIPPSPSSHRFQKSVLYLCVSHIGSSVLSY